MKKHAGYVSYAWWKHFLFWGLWLLLLVPGYIAAFGAWLIGSMLPSFHEPVDIILTLIMALTLFLIMGIAVYTAWHFIKRSKVYSDLLIILSVGLLGLPLMSTAGAFVSYCSATECVFSSEPVDKPLVEDYLPVG